MAGLPGMELYMEALQRMVPAAHEAKKHGWKESKQRVEKANKEVQKLKGNQKRLEDSIRGWESKADEAKAELKSTKNDLATAYEEQKEAQQEKRGESLKEALEKQRHHFQMMAMMRWGSMLRRSSWRKPPSTSSWPGTSSSRRRKRETAPWSTPVPWSRLPSGWQRTWQSRPNWLRRLKPLQRGPRR
eukprot:315783-Heterocapsa_arctica.AAC.1